MTADIHIMLTHLHRAVFCLFLIAGFELLGLEEARAATAKDPGLNLDGMRVVVESDVKEGINSNLIANASFEFLDGNRPKSWVWRLRSADADYKIVHDAHTGKNAINIHNRTPKAPNVFGQLVLEDRVRLIPGQTYTLSAFVKAEDPGKAWIGGGGRSWRVRLQLGKTHRKWRRFETSFTATEKEEYFRLMITTGSPTNNLIVDDIKLEKGEIATPFFDPALCNHAVELIADAPDEVAVPSEEVLLKVFAYLRSDTPPVPAHVTLTSETGKVAGQITTGNLLPGLNRLAIMWRPDDRPEKRYHLEIHAGKQKEVVDFELFMPTRYDVAQQAAQSQINAIQNLVDEAVNSDIPVDYPRAALAIAKRFTGVAVKKLNKGLLVEAVKDLEYIGKLCASQFQEIQAVKNGTKPALKVPDPPLDRIKIHDGNFWVGDNPVMLIGAMGWVELKSELSTYRDYGFNVIGDDYDVFSSFKMLIDENKVDETAVPRLIESWKHLHAMNLAVSYTPHLSKIPDWALEKYPDIIGGRSLDELPRWDPVLKRSGRGPGLYGRFFPFAIDSSNLKQLVERYYATLMPGLNALPGFRVLWLMNEPSYQSCDEHYMQLFREYLQHKFTGIEALNAAWNTSYKGFGVIDCPAKPGRPKNFDWLTFNQNQVSGWFNWLAEKVRKYYPQAILSNKPSAARLLQPQLGIDFEREAELWDIPGSDTFRSPEHWRYAYDWSRRSVMLLDFQKSVAPDKPLADHEFHYVHKPDVSDRYVRAAYFHSYLHGLRMSQFWIWATGNLIAKSAPQGKNYTAWSQPEAAWGTASSALDLRRLAGYVAAFPQKPQVMIYFSSPSLFLSGDSYAAVITETYEAANGIDAPVGFITDRMIRKGRLKECKLLIIAGAEFIEADTRSAIQNFVNKGGRVAMTGDCLKKDEYGRVHQDRITDTQNVINPLHFNFQVDSLEALVFQLDKVFETAGIFRPVRIRQKNGQPAWPIEARAVPKDKGMVCYLIGLNKQTVEIALEGAKKVTGWKDLISGEDGQGNTIEIRPLDVRLLMLEFQDSLAK